ncbi:ras family-domain-containing protein [Multifurca ochricompacta]|uniref:Ras family-domain-containing protein n=1 Tax=Multifurca ochricompacta TaxID=376703 RepID=A0AAD4M4W9_9AGAM|nr:ras family-domain-containing protein [Multifurca ochricompacta]
MPTRTNSIMQSNESVSIKLLIIGIASVGKSSLLFRFTDQQWLPEGETNPTIGVDTYEHKLDVKGKRVILNIWDTAGDERLRAITSSYYRGTQGIILVYDVTNRESFNAISWWFTERSKNALELAVKMIVGNKSDKSHMRQVPTAEGAAYAARMGCLFVESSAKTAVGVREMFRDVVERILDIPEFWGPSKQAFKAPNDLAHMLK